MKDGLTRFGGVRFRLPEGWSFKSDKDTALARSPSGDAGFLIGVGSLEHSAEVLHKADEAFGVRFPVALGQLAQINRLRLLLNKEAVPAPGGQVNLSVLLGKGPASESLAIFVFVKAPPGTKNEEVAAWALSLDLDAP